LLVGVVLGALVLIACGGSSPRSSSEPTDVVIRTLASPGPNDICMLARGGGTLAVDAVSGLGWADTPGHMTHGSWPFGYTAHLIDDRLELVDGQGRIVARVGDVIGMTGGFVTDDDWSACQSEPITVLATRSP
jgi:hypothetical protein